jgi:sortase A
MSSFAPSRIRLPNPAVWIRKQGPRRQVLARPASLSVSTAATVWALSALSALSLWVLLYGFVFSGLQQHRDNAVLYAQLREQIAGETAPLGGVIKPGSPVAVLSIPQLGLHNTVIVEGTASSQLRSGPGHRRDSPLPGQPGVAQIYGKAATFGAPFGRIGELEKGQQLTVSTGQGVFTYVVDGVRRQGDPLPPPLASGGSRLLLQTASGGLLPSHPLYVDATLKGSAQPSPAGRPSAVPANEQSMAIDTSGLLPLVFWMQALVVIAVGLVWVRQRTGLWTAWLIGVPLVVAAIWGASQNVLALLPNLV